MTAFGTSLPIPNVRAVAAKSVVPTIEQLPDARGERSLRERLLNHLDAWVEPAVVHDGIARIAGHEQHLDAVRAGDDFVGKPAVPRR